MNCGVSTCPYGPVAVATGAHLRTSTGIPTHTSVGLGAITVMMYSYRYPGSCPYGAREKKRATTSTSPTVAELDRAVQGPRGPKCGGAFMSGICQVCHPGLIRVRKNDGSVRTAWEYGTIYEPSCCRSMKV
eukprot:scaffold177251_cov25-Prasinocladus_malaysianus.AAC.2